MRGDYRKYTILLLLLIVLLGTFLRIYDLGKENLWLDEGYTLATAEKSTSELLDSLYEYEINPPAYFLMIHYWISLFGTSEFSLRFPSVIFGLISIFLIYLLGKEWFNKKTGLISAMLMSISMLNIEYSQEARTYTLLVMVTLLSLYFFTRLLKKGAPSHYIAYVLATAALLYIHYLGIYIILLENFVIFIFFLKKTALLKRWIISQLAIVLLFLPWLPRFIFQMEYWITGWRETLIGEFGLPVFLGNFGVLLMAIPLLVAFIMLGILIVLIHYGKVKPGEMISRLRFSKNYFMAFAAVYLILAVLILPRISTPFHTTKFSLFLLPLFYILLARGIALLRDKKLQSALLILILLASSFVMFNYYNTTRKEEWKDLSGFIDTNAGENDAVLLCVDTNQIVFNYYYAGSIQQVPLRVSIIPKQNMELFKSIKPQIEGRDLWLVRSHCRKAKGFYKAELDKIAKEDSKKTFNGIEVFHYKGG